MATPTQKKTTRLGRGYSAPKTETKWKRSPHLIDSLVIGAVEYTSSEKEKSRSLGLKDSDSPYNLKMVGRKVLVEEEPLEATVDKASGLTKEVCDALSSGLLVLSDQSEYALMKYPFKGTVLAVGERCKWVKVGYRIHFAKLGYQRFEFRGKQFLVMHEDDVHGTYASKS